MPFGSATVKCGRCNKSVYANEEVKACGRSYHENSCFKCKMCNKSLELTTVVDNDNEIYCKSCHSKSFGPKGFRGGGGGGPTTTGIADPIAVGGRRDSTRGCAVSDCALPAVAGKSYCAAHHNTFSGSSSGSAGAGAVCPGCSKPASGKFCSNCGEKLTVAAAPHPAQSIVKPSPAPKSGGVTMKFGGAPKCPRCSKSVYAAEEKKAIGLSWHGECFKCATCTKSLDSTTLADNEGEIYCRSCHGKNFGPKGFGIGSAGAVHTGQ